MEQSVGVFMSNRGIIFYSAFIGVYNLIKNFNLIEAADQTLHQAAEYRIALQVLNGQSESV
jgi:hypothetical protein